MMHLENGEFKPILKNSDRKHSIQLPWNVSVNMNHKKQITKANQKSQKKLQSYINIIMRTQEKLKKKKFAKNTTKINWIH
jgi:hypothetical protein